MGRFLIINILKIYSLLFQSTNSNIVNRIKRNPSGYYTSGNYVSSYIQNQSSKYYYLNNYSIELYVWIPKVLQKGDSIYNAYKSIEAIRHIIGIKAMICLISTAILVVLLYLKNKENSRMHEVDILIEKLKKYPIEYKLGGLLLSYIIYKLIFNSYYNKIFGVNDSYKAPEKIMSILYNKEEREKLKDFTPSQVYKLTGNSIVVPVLKQVFYEYFKALKDNGKLDGMDMAS